MLANVPRNAAAAAVAVAVAALHCVCHVTTTTPLYCIHTFHAYTSSRRSHAASRWPAQAHNSCMLALRNMSSPPPPSIVQRLQNCSSTHTHTLSLSLSLSQNTTALHHAGESRLTRGYLRQSKQREEKNSVTADSVSCCASTWAVCCAKCQQRLVFTECFRYELFSSLCLTAERAISFASVISRNF